MASFRMRASFLRGGDTLRGGPVEEKIDLTMPARNTDLVMLARSLELTIPASNVDLTLP